MAIALALRASLIKLPEDHLIFRVLMTSIGWHLLLVVNYFVWYFFQRRYTAQNHTDHIPNPHHSTASALQPEACGLPPRGPSDEVPLSPTQVTFSSHLPHVSSAAQRRVLELGNEILTFTVPLPSPTFLLELLNQETSPESQKLLLKTNSIRTGPSFCNQRTCDESQPPPQMSTMDFSDAFRLVNLGVGALMVAGGIAHIFPEHYLADIIVGIYVAIFGLAIALLEFQIPPQISRYASFLFSFIGRGIFYIFCGSILLEHNTIDIVFGTVIGIIGVVYVVLEFIPSIEPPQNMREADGGWGAEQV